jgi:DNA-binding GntR family transcriptional regulator
MKGQFMTKRTINEHYKYNKLIAALRKKIFSGEFGEDGKLPPERQLLRCLIFPESLYVLR